MKQIINRISFLTIALIIGGLMTPACSSATKANANNNPCGHTETERFCDEQQRQR